MIELLIVELLIILYVTSNKTIEKNLHQYKVFELFLEETEGLY